MNAADGRKPGIQHPESAGRALAAVVTVLLGLAGSAPLRADTDAKFKQLLEEKSPAVVTVKFVLKVKSQFGDTEQESEISGVMVSPDGLVLCSNTQLQGFAAFMRGSAAGSVTPTDIRILAGDDTEGLEAALVARDTELDLVWIRIKNAGDRRFTCIDLEKTAAPEIGDRLYAVTRLPKYFDRTPVVREARLAAVTRKPRRLYVPSTGLGARGLAVFSSSGEFVGVAVTQMPDPAEMEAARGMGGAGLQELILPASDVFKATQRARETERRDELPQ